MIPEQTIAPGALPKKRLDELKARQNHFDPATARPLRSNIREELAGQTRKTVSKGGSV
jgi:hypothetical protein